MKGLKDGAGATVRDIRRQTRKQYSAEEKIRIVVAGLRGEDSIAELTEGRGSNFMLFQSWPKFGDRFRPPAPRLDLFTGPWERAGPHPSFYINTLSGQASHM